MATLFKLGSVCGETITQFRYSNTFQVERTTGPDRLRIGVGEAPLSLLWRLAFALQPPFSFIFCTRRDAGASSAGIKAQPSNLTL